MSQKLTDRFSLERSRAKAHVDVLQREALLDLQDRIELVNRSFTEAALVTGFPKVWQELLPEAKIVDDTPELALESQAHDLLVHAMALHWADDPVGQLIQSRRALKPDGLFLGVFLGGRTLQELRIALAQAESDITGGLSPRVAPMAELRDAGALLQRAGFALPVADSFDLTIHYQDIWSLMRDLRAMGESNALDGRLRRPTRRAIFERAGQIYSDTFTKDGRIVATFEFVVLTGWAPAASQPQPLRPGTATNRLADALNTAETKLKD